MCPRYTRVDCIVSFTFDTEGLKKATGFIQEAIPLIYETHRHLVSGFFFSKHIKPNLDPPMNDVWLCYRIPVEMVDTCQQIISERLNEILNVYCMCSTWKVHESEDSAFQDIPKYMPEWPGTEFLPTLWVQCEFASLQAYNVLTKANCPAFFYSWSKHIFLNGLGLE